MIFCLTPKVSKPNAYSELRGVEGPTWFLQFLFFFFPSSSIVFLLPLKVSIKFLAESRLLKCT